MENEIRDVFICHAGEDKEEIIRPMVEFLNQAGITYWYDEAEINWGDSISQKVNDGLKMSRYAMVVFSKNFIDKKWPERELNAVLNIEASSGEVTVLPLLVGSEQEKLHILNTYPLLNDKQYLPWDGNLRKIVEALLRRLKKSNINNSLKSPVQKQNIGLKIPLPKIQKQFTQRDKDIFLRESFDIVKDYFKKALTELEKTYQEVQTDYNEIHKYKFICTIYVRGEISSRCKIWLGGSISSDSIAYNSGQFNIENDNSFNEILSVMDNQQSLGFSTSYGSITGYPLSKDELLSAEQAGEYLWRRFTDNLN